MSQSRARVDTPNGPVWVSVRSNTEIEIANIGFPEAGWLSSPTWQPFMLDGVPYSVSGSLVRAHTGPWFFGPDTFLTREDGVPNLEQQYAYDASLDNRGRIQDVIVQEVETWLALHRVQAEQQMREYAGYRASFKYQQASETLTRIEAEIARLQVQADDQRRIMREAEPYLEKGDAA